VPVNLDGKLVVAISSRALFNFEEENTVFEKGDSAKYREYQKSRLDESAEIGAAFPLVKKLLAFNADGEHRVEVVILSRNDPVSGLRVYKSAHSNGLNIERGVFTQGRAPFHYLKALKADLFLSANESDVREALNNGFPAAKVYPDSLQTAQKHPDEIRIAFDGDAVLFSDEAEQVFQNRGLDVFQGHEQEHASRPLSAGPFKSFLQGLHRLQSLSQNLPINIRTVLVTARGAPAHERAIRTLMEWEIEVDEAMFLAGLNKAPFLAEFEPDFFFDDQVGHCESAAKVTPTGHVVSGVSNTPVIKDCNS
jgi:5'-nucleotidase